MARVRLLPALFLGACIATVGFAHAQTPAPRIRGDITAVSGKTLQLKADSGQTVPLKLADKVSISARAHADQTKIVTGAFLGTTAVPGPDGTLVASEVHIFDESMRGTGEGHRPMDTSSGSTMTNATVASVTSDDQERRMTLRYAGGEKVVVVPKDTPVVTIEPGDASLLVVGAHVVVSGARQSDGSMLVDRIQVGKDGFIPPL